MSRHDEYGKRTGSLRRVCFFVANLEPVDMQRRLDSAASHYRDMEKAATMFAQKFEAEQLVRRAQPGSCRGGSLQEREDLLREAIQLDPQNASAHFYLFTLLYGKTGAKPSGNAVLQSVSTPGKSVTTMVWRFFWTKDAATKKPPPPSAPKPPNPSKGRLPNRSRPSKTVIPFPAGFIHWRGVNFSRPSRLKMF